MQRLEWHCHTKSVSGALYKAISYHGQSAGKEMANFVVLNFRRNAGSDWISVTEVGRKFQARDAAARNARSPMVARWRHRTICTYSSVVSSVVTISTEWRHIVWMLPTNNQRVRLWHWRLCVAHIKWANWATRKHNINECKQANLIILYNYCTTSGFG